MVRGLDLFRDRFRAFEGSFVLIGGAACEQWFAAEGLEFRATRDLDIVLIVEVLAPEAVKALRRFIAEGGYEIRQRFVWEVSGPGTLNMFAIGAQKRVLFTEATMLPV